MAMVYGWLAVVVIAIIVEVIVPGLVSIWFVPSALVAMVLAFFSVPVIIQVAVFLVSSGLFIFLSRKFKILWDFVGFDKVPLLSGCLVWMA